MQRSSFSRVIKGGSKRHGSASGIYYTDGLPYIVAMTVTLDKRLSESNTCTIGLSVGFSRRLQRDNDNYFVVISCMQCKQD